MRELPIPFKTEMVRAILDGRKTQTRRPIDCIHKIVDIAMPEEWDAGRADPNMRRFEEWGSRDSVFLFRSSTGTVFGMPSPYKPDDHLWVRETWYPMQDIEECMKEGESIEIAYKADYDADGITREEARDIGIDRWRPPLFMPKWAARIFMTVMKVTVQRPRELNARDLWGEGLEFGTGAVYQGELQWKNLWTKLHGKDGWQKNEWCFVYHWKEIEVK